MSGHANIGQIGCMNQPHVDDLYHAEREDPGVHFEIVDKSKCPVCNKD